MKATSKRERLIAITAAAVLGLLAVDQLLIEPLLANSAEVRRQTELAQLDLDRAARLFSTSRRMNRQWMTMTAGGLRRDVPEAESLVLHSVRDWAQESHLALSSLKPERTEKTKDFFTVTIRATGAGSMDQIGRMLHHIQTASIPVRITELQITSRKEGNDDLAVTFGVATIGLTGDSSKPVPSQPARIVGRDGVQ